MTLHFTALGILIAYLWVSSVAQLLLGVLAATEKRTWLSLWYFALSITLVVLLILR